MNKDWSELQKQSNALLTKRATFDKGIAKLLELRDILFQEIEKIFKEISVEDFSKQPLINSDGYDSKTIAYSIYHIFRVEDIVMNTLINGDTQIFFKNDYKVKLNSPIITTGNELKKEEIAEFSKQLNISELFNYAKEVYEQSNNCIKLLEMKDFKRKFLDPDRNRIVDSNSVEESEHWLIYDWCRKGIKDLLCMPFSRHWIMHIEASLRIAKKLMK